MSKEYIILERIATIEKATQEIKDLLKEGIEPEGTSTAAKSFKNSENWEIVRQFMDNCYRKDPLDFVSIQFIAQDLKENAGLEISTRTLGKLLNNYFEKKSITKIIDGKKIRGYRISQY